MNRDELLALPVTVDVWPTTAAVFEMSRMTAYRLAKSGDFPVPVIKVGRKYRVSTAEILKKLGIDPNQRGEVDPATVSADASVPATRALT